jgi:hypothetical protein
VWCGILLYTTIYYYILSTPSLNPCFAYSTLLGRIASTLRAWVGAWVAPPSPCLSPPNPKAKARNLVNPTARYIGESVYRCFFFCKNNTTLPSLSFFPVKFTTFLALPQNLSPSPYRGGVSTHTPTHPPLVEARKLKTVEA